jgi:hypothetical protein
MPGCIRDEQYKNCITEEIIGKKEWKSSGLEKREYGREEPLR